jgi:hypothetical protein
MADLYRLTASQARESIITGQFTIEDYVRSLLARIQDREFIKAWAYLDPSYALSQAKHLDSLPPEKRGPLHGVVIGVKDVILTKGMYCPSCPLSPGALAERGQICPRGTIRPSTKARGLRWLMLLRSSPFVHPVRSSSARQQLPSLQAATMAAEPGRETRMGQSTLLAAPRPGLEPPSAITRCLLHSVPRLSGVPSGPDRSMAPTPSRYAGPLPPDASFISNRSNGIR